MNINWNYPTAMRTGEGRIAEIADICKEFNMSAPLLVTDPGLAQLQMVSNIIELCQSQGLGVKLFSDIKPNPTGSNVSNGIESYLGGQHDGVIALGGGSGLDAGKAIAVAARQDCSMWDLEDVGDNWLNADPDKIPPIVAVPTTAGTGSEVGRASVIVNEEQERKAIIFHPKMLPDCVILDPELTTGLPAMLTAATGMDALSHNLEAFCSPMYHPMAEGIAIEGIRLIKQNLEQAVADGSDVEARRQMLVASSMGATAFQRGLGGMHALAHPLGAIYDAHHGTLNAVLMPYVLIANRTVIEKPIARLARYLDLSPDFDAFLDWILKLRDKISIPNDLEAIGIDDQRLDALGEMAVADPSAGTNPILHDASAYTRIVTKALNGDLT
ncbi:MAG: iron-containing alcohol dehydrogenase [bacterium]